MFIKLDCAQENEMTNACFARNNILLIGIKIKREKRRKFKKVAAVLKRKHLENLNDRFETFKNLSCCKSSRSAHK